MTQPSQEEGETLLHIGKLANTNSSVVSVVGGENGNSSPVS